MKISNLVTSLAVPLPKSQCWKNCALGKSKGRKNILPRGRGKYISINVMFLKYFLSTLSLLKAVDHQSFYYFVKKAVELAEFSVEDLFILVVQKFSWKVHKV